MTIMYGFELGREFRLSIAEIYEVFPNINVVYLDKSVFVVDGLDRWLVLQMSKKLWWTIKIFEIVNRETKSSNQNSHIEGLFSNIEILDTTQKFKYWVSIFWEKWISILSALKISKNVFRSKWVNPRYINKDNKSLSSIQIIKEALVWASTDYNIINLWDKILLWVTIFVQDIYSYSNRDYGKSRDMKVGMLPPKLAQMMINIWDGSPKDKAIYDPFVWLWTILIESVYMWNTKIYGSDKSDHMVTKSAENIWALKRDFYFLDKIFTQNARYVDEIDIIKDVDLIVTEWFLWEIMTKNNISSSRIEKQSDILLPMYEWFFKWLKKLWYNKNIVISFPFWDYEWKYMYLDEIYILISKYFDIIDLLPKNISYETTKYWSLLYKRDGQLVGREIFKLRLK